jgi:hypothetical protein
MPFLTSRRFCDINAFSKKDGTMPQLLASMFCFIASHQKASLFLSYVFKGSHIGNNCFDNNNTIAETSVVILLNNNNQNLFSNTQCKVDNATY